MARLVEYSESEVVDWIDETNPGVIVLGMSYSPGEIIRELDSVAFRCIEAERPERWECEECDKEHESEEEANQCCEEGE